MRYQELNWYVGSEFTPTLDRPVLVRTAKNVILRAVRIAVPEVDYGCVYILWNFASTPTADDISIDNILTVTEVIEWSYL